MPYSTPYAPTAKDLNSCIECGLCLPVCPTFRLTGRETASPRGRLTAMSAVLAGRPIDDAFEDIISTCLQCLACEPACPAFVPFGRAMEGARAELAAARPTRSRKLRKVILGRGLASRWWVRLATTGAALVQRTRMSFLIPARLRAGFGALRRLPLWAPSRVGQTFHPPEDLAREQRGTVGLLVGCVMDPWFGAVNEAAILLLTKAGYTVQTPAAQSCCGALAAHDGAAEVASQLAFRQAAAFAAVDWVVVTSAGCGAHIKDYSNWTQGGEVIAAKTRDITEMIADAIANGWLPTITVGADRVAIQDPCHLRHAQRIVDQPRLVVEAAGHPLVEIDTAGMCCGAAGIYSVLQQELSSQLGENKAGEVRAAGPKIVASANPGCEMQLRQYLGRDYRIAHPIELYAEAIGIMDRGPA